MKYYIIAGEASGDLHASNLIKELKKLEPAAQFRGWGGDLMGSQGVDLVKHIRDLAFMGFSEVLANLGTILRNIKLCKEDIAEWKPDVIIFVDYPGFNLRICEWAKKQGFKTIYYISPQLWAWKEGRVEKIRRHVDLMMVTLPFEEVFYQKHHVKVHFVGHPLLDAVDQYIPSYSFTSHGENKKIIALLPGSRKQEIRAKLPVMLSVVNDFIDYRFIIAGAPAMDADFYKEIINGKNIEITFGRTYDLLSQSAAALVTSGTATLETALFEVPEVVCYKGQALSVWLARRLIKVKYISLVNLIMDRVVVKELIQEDLTHENLVAELNKLLENQGYRSKMINDYKLMKEKLGGSGASARGASLIYNFLHSA